VGFFVVLVGKVGLLLVVLFLAADGRFVIIVVGFLVMGRWVDGRLALVVGSRVVILVVVGRLVGDVVFVIHFCPLQTPSPP
jgi:hypothetical protein